MVLVLLLTRSNNPIIGCLQRSVFAPPRWKKLDVDGDGTVSPDEFLHFAYSVRTKSTNRVGKFLANVKLWWNSNPVVTMKRILLGYLQAVSAIPALYGPLRSDPAQPRADDHHEGDPRVTSALFNATAFFNATYHETLSSTDTVQSSLQATFAKYSNLLSNVDLTFSQWFKCLLGPRFTANLLFNTLLPLLLLAFAAFVIPALLVAVQLSVRCTCRRYNKQVKMRVDKLLSAVGSFSRFFSSVVLLILYPSSARVVLQAFECRSYVSGADTNLQFLKFDLALRCPLYNDPTYGAVFPYALLMVLLIVVGWPLYLYTSVRRWRYPTNRLHEIDENGKWVPTHAAEENIGGLFVMYTPRKKKR